MDQDEIKIEKEEGKEEIMFVESFKQTQIETNHTKKILDNIQYNLSLQQKI